MSNLDAMKALREEMIQTGIELAGDSPLLKDDPATQEMVARRFVDRTGVFHDPGNWLEERQAELAEQMSSVSEVRRLANIRGEDMDNKHSKGTSMERE